MQRTRLAVIAASSLIVFISLGLRQANGVFMHPIVLELGMSREAFGFAVATQNLLLGLPLAAYLTDRFQPRYVLIIGGVLYAASLFTMSFADSPGYVWLVLGIFTGIAQSATMFAVTLSAVNRVVKPERRATAFGIVTAMSSLGMFVMVWLSGFFIDRLGWRHAYDALALCALLMIFLAAFIPVFKNETGQSSRAGFMQLLAAVRNHGSYWMLTMGFYVCGFHVAFIAIHLPAYVVDMGLDSSIAYTALALIGLFNIAGSILFGWLGDRYRKKDMLALLYGARGIIISGFVLVPLNDVTAIAFGCLIGFLWLGTVPLTSGLVGQFYNGRYLGTLYGIVFMGHQLGAFTGAWLGGRIYDITGSYDAVWTGAIVLSFLAAGLHFMINDRPVELRLKTA